MYLCIYKCYLAYSYFRFCFRHVLTYSSIIQEHTHAYSEPSVSLVFLKSWHISIPKTVRYIHNTILNIFTKAQSCTFNTVLKALVFYRCYLTSRVTLQYRWGYTDVILRLYCHIWNQQPLICHKGVFHQYSGFWHRVRFF